MRCIQTVEPFAAARDRKITTTDDISQHVFRGASQEITDLIDRRLHKRKNAIMAGFAATLSDEDMRNVAAFYASKTAKPGAAKDKDLATLGEKIYRGGIGDRNIPACAGCHSPNGAGIPAQYPRLSGQHADYTASQLVAFRDGVRKNSLQMTQVAAKLNDREIRAVADYIAGLR